MEDPRRQLPQRGDRLAHTDALQTTDLNLLQRKSFGRDQPCFEAALCTDEEHLVPPLPQFARHRQRRNHMPPGPAARHEKNLCIAFTGQPACSDTFIKMPSDTSVLSSELPPELSIGRGIPLVGISPSTTLIFRKACIT